jgi:microcompartment protein CcmK/EutM
MIALLGASAIFLTAGQAVINGPRDAFKTCLKEASSKASNDKVTADGYDAYIRNACGAQLGSFKGAVVKFDMGNKMSRKASDEDANAMIADFVGSGLDHYKYITGANSAVKEASAAKPPLDAAKPQPIPASQPQPPK